MLYTQKGSDTELLQALLKVGHSVNFFLGWDNFWFYLYYLAIRKLKQKTYPILIKIQLRGQPIL